MEPTEIRCIIRPVGRTADVLAAIPCGRSKLYNLLANDPTFPSPWRCGRDLRWFLDEIETWKANRPRRRYRPEARE